jgi:hypothetical protein
MNRLILALALLALASAPTCSTDASLQARVPGLDNGTVS